MVEIEELEVIAAPVLTSLWENTGEEIYARRQRRRPFCSSSVFADSSVGLIDEEFTEITC